MNKSEFIKNMQDLGEYNSTKEASRAYDAFIGALVKGLQNEEKIQLPGFGTFAVKERASKVCTNPQTGAKITVPATKAPAFKFSDSFKAIAINKD